MLLDLIHPVANILITLFLCAVIAKNNAIRAFVICLSNSPESLLASRVPDLELYILAVDRYVLDLEVDSWM